ncbi:ommochrome-binding protein-like [Battus philenor]|uniref:ommochrome-binding protein-like n=1 Tax=Battus philenor TaxID=42288 RepID=UPI0035D0FB08
MAYKFLLICLMAVPAKALDDTKECKPILYDGKYHSEQLVKTDIYKPSSLAVDRKTNTLYYSYIHRTKEITYKTAKVNLRTKEYVELDVNNGFSITVDEKHHVAYIGGYKGVYKYNERSNKGHLIIPGVNIWNVFYKNALYYIEFLSQKIYKYQDGKSIPFGELSEIKVYYFVIDDENYMVYSNGTGIYGKQMGTKDTITYKKFDSVDIVRDITLDRNGKVYIATNEGIYRVNKVHENLEKVLEVQEAYGMAFDGENHLIYSKEDAVIRLVPQDCIQD